MATIEQQRAGALVGRARVGWGIGVLAGLALVAVAVAAMVVVSQAPSATVGGSPAKPSIYTEDELEVFRLVDAGVLPASVLDAEPFSTKLLVSTGVIPRETLLPGISIRPPLYCPDERAVMRAVSAGIVPAAVLDGEPFRTKRLIARGLIPWQSAEPCF